MLNEKYIYQRWMKRFGYPVSPLEEAVDRNMSGVKKLQKISFKTLQASLQHKKLLLVGDDANVGMQQEIFLKQIIPVLSNRNVLVVTNRSDTQMIKALRSRGITVQKIAEGGISSQNKGFNKRVHKVWEQFDHIIVWTGHLRVGSAPFQKQFESLDGVSIYLQCNSLKWKFPAVTGWNKCKKGYVWMDGSPLISVDHHRSSEEKDFIMIRPEMLEGILLQMMSLIAKTMKQSSYQKPKTVLHVFDHAHIRQIQRLKHPGLKKFLEERIMNGESAAIPSQKMILLSTLNSSHLAEEAAHYLRTSGHGDLEYGPAMTLIEEALAFFASLLLFPNRRIPMLKNPVNVWDEVHMAGYALGWKLWKLWSRSVSSRSMIQKLWKLHPQNEFEAEMMFQVLTDLQ